MFLRSRSHGRRGGSFDDDDDGSCFRPMAGAWLPRRFGGVPPGEALLWVEEFSSHVSVVV